MPFTNQARAKWKGNKNETCQKNNQSQLKHCFKLINMHKK